jgi:hypothetical protein
MLSRFDGAACFVGILCLFFLLVAGEAGVDKGIGGLHWAKFVIPNDIQSYGVRSGRGVNLVVHTWDTRLTHMAYHFGPNPLAIAIFELPDCLTIT